MIGINGEVTCPPRNSKDVNFVGKIVRDRKEFDNINIISKYPEYEFLNKSELEVYRYQLVLPKIEGEELFSFLQKFKNEDQLTNLFNPYYGADLKIMDVDTFNFLIITFIDLYRFILKLNSDGLYHNDVSTKNVIFDGYKMFLIDFETLSSTKSEFLRDPDISGLECILEEIFKCAYYDEYLRNIMIEYNLVMLKTKFIRLNIKIDKFVEIFE